MVKRLVAVEIQPDAPAAARKARLQGAVVIGDAHHAHSRQRLRVADQLAFGSGDQDDLEFVREAHLSLADSPVERARLTVNSIEQFDLAGQRFVVDQLRDRVKIARGTHSRNADRTDVGATLGDVRGGQRGLAYGGDVNLVAVRVAR